MCGGARRSGRPVFFCRRGVGGGRGEREIQRVSVRRGWEEEEEEEEKETGTHTKREREREGRGTNQHRQRQRTRDRNRDVHLQRNHVAAPHHHRLPRHEHAVHLGPRQRGPPLHLGRGEPAHVPPRVRHEDGDVGGRPPGAGSQGAVTGRGGPRGARVKGRRGRGRLLELPQEGQLLGGKLLGRLGETVGRGRGGSLGEGAAAEEVGEGGGAGGGLGGGGRRGGALVPGLRGGEETREM